MTVSDSLKQAYLKGSVQKNLKITFTGLNYTVPYSDITYESMKLDEAVFDGDSFEFVGCIASKFEAEIKDFGKDMKNQKISVQIILTGFESEPIPLFNGIIDDVSYSTNSTIKKITAYDQLYTKGNIDVAGWYNSLSFPISLKTLRDSLFSYIGLEQIQRALPNDNIKIYKEWAPETMQAIVAIKSICQINGVFGIINRYDKFEYRTLLTVEQSIDGSYPGSMLLPGFYPSLGIKGNAIVEEVPFLKNFSYKEFKVKPVDKITIRNSEDDANAISFGSGENNYIIQGNIFAYGSFGYEQAKNELDKQVTDLTSKLNNLYKTRDGLREDVQYQTHIIEELIHEGASESRIQEHRNIIQDINTMLTRIDNDIAATRTQKNTLSGTTLVTPDVYRLAMAKNIYPYIQNITYTPYDVTNAGLPWIECGISIVEHYVYDFKNSVSTDIYKKIQCYVLNRQLSGIQGLADKYKASGDEEQRKFITDINANIRVLQNEQKNTETTIKQEIESVLGDSVYDTIEKTIKDEIDGIVDEEIQLQTSELTQEVQQQINDVQQQISDGLKAVSVAELPAEIDYNTIYLIQGEVTVE